MMKRFGDDPMESKREHTHNSLRRVNPVVLCVDDEGEILRALRRCLRSEPYEVITARSASEALGCLEEFPVDLVITDHRMPGTDGTELLMEIRKRSPKTARAILTGYPGETVIRKGLEAGADTFLYKPWDDERLKGTIRRLLTKETQKGSTRQSLPGAGEEPSEKPYDLGGEGGSA